jgi:hypothetical protein
MSAPETTPTLQELLTQHCKGVLYPSESDEPIEYFSLDLPIDQKLSKHEIAKAFGANKAEVKEWNFEDFFGPVVQIKSWFGQEETENAEAIKKIGQLLIANTADYQVFRIGKIEIIVVIIGKSSNSRWEGIKTLLIET